MSTVFRADESPEIEVRPGVLRPDWAIVTLPAAGDALRARSSSRSSLIDCWLIALSPVEDLVWRRALVLFADLARAPRADEIAADTGLPEESVRHILVTLQDHDWWAFRCQWPLSRHPFTDRATATPSLSARVGSTCRARSMRLALARCTGKMPSLTPAAVLAAWRSASPRPTWEER